MDHLSYLYGLLVLLAAGLAAIAIWAPRQAMLKLAALALAALLMAGGYGGLLEVLGRPKPVALILSGKTAEDATVVATRIREGEAIYLWLESEAAPVPRAYVLPWSLEDAKQLNKAQRQAKAVGTKVQMRQDVPSDRVTEEPLFYAQPQTALPDKAAQTQQGE